MLKLLYKTKSKTKFWNSLQITRRKKKTSFEERNENKIENTLESKTHPNQADLNVTGGSFAYLYFKVSLRLQNKMLLPFLSFIDKVS